MFTRLQHALKTAKGCRINLTTPVHEELTVWRHLVASLATGQRIYAKSGRILPHGLEPQMPPSPAWEESDAAQTETGTYGD